MRSTALTGIEIESWRRAAERMYVPRHEQLGIVLQDEHFLDRERWTSRNPGARASAAAALSPAELYRHQVIKQTDVVLATYLVDSNFRRGGNAAHVRLLRPADHRRLHALGLRPEHRRVRDRLRRACAALLHGRLRGRPARHARQHGRRHPRRILRRDLARARRRLRRVARLRRRTALHPRLPTNGMACAFASRPAGSSSKST